VNKLKVVLDTNIYVSAIFWKGNPYKIIQNALNEEFSVFLSQDIINELKRVLARDFALSEELINENIDAMLAFAAKTEITHKVNVIKDDPDDDRILECALSAGAGYIVSQDNHLLNLKEYKDIRIINPKEFLELKS
jgi:uncharacterized protein